MLSYSEIKRGKIIEYNNEPYKVMFNNVAKKNRNKPTNQTKLKSLISGKNIEVVFHSKDKVNEAVIERNNIKYLYQKGDEVWFSEAENPKERFFLDFKEISEELKFLKQNDIVRGLYFNENFIGIDISPKVELKVKESPDAVKGNTSSGAQKEVILENGLKVFTPLFINEGDILIISTEDGKYSERKK